jgi:hypothetical protein
MSILKAGLEHAKNHVEYPATKKQLVEACNNMSDMPKAEREWFAKNLPDKTYKNANEVFKALIDTV